MAIPKKHSNVLLLCAVVSRYDCAIEWAQEKVVDGWGTIRLESDRFEYNETKYYESTMGLDLKKQFFVVGGFYDPQRLPKTKLQSNAWEDELSSRGEYPEARPVNIDPGYLTLTKLVLASAKDRAHRIYIADGIYGEECLYYLDHRWQSRPWTYPDYQRADFQAFFVDARELLRELY